MKKMPKRKKIKSLTNNKNKKTSPNKIHPDEEEVVTKAAEADPEEAKEAEGVAVMVAAEIIIIIIKTTEGVTVVEAIETTLEVAKGAEDNPKTKTEAVDVAEAIKMAEDDKMMIVSQKKKNLLVITK